LLSGYLEIKNCSVNINGMGGENKNP